MRFDIPIKLLCQTDICSKITDGPPINVEIDLCNRCSLGCEFCHFAHTHTKGPLSESQSVEVGDVIDTDLACDILKMLTDYGVRSVTYSGGGEPTLHPDHLKILEHGKSLRLNGALGQGMYTNGCHIHKADAWKYARYLDWVYVSLDAADVNEYKRIKSVDRFHDACDGIKMLVGAGTTVGVGCMVTADNYRKLDAVVDLVYLLGASYVQFRPTVRYDHHSPSQLAEPALWALEVEKPYHPRIPVEMDLERFREYANWINHGYETCWWSAVQTVITPDGKVWTCCNKRGISCIGDLTRQTFRKIWESRPIAKVDSQCRIMCRGHMGNQILDRVMSGTVPNGNFV